MNVARRYLRLLAVQLRASFLLAVTYRSDFLVDALIEVLWAITTVVPLLVVFASRRQVAGWTYGEALLVTGFFTLLSAFIEGVVNPSLGAVVEHVRKGTFDFVLLKPADAQFLVSTARVQPWRAVNVVTALVIFVHAFRRLGTVPSVGAMASASVLLVAAAVLLYSFFVLTTAAAFYVVRIDNLMYLFTSVFDAARWPSSVFRGVLHVVFTFVVPLALMTTYPAEALLGRMSYGAFGGAVTGALLAAVVSRQVWVRAIGRYTSTG